MEHCWETIFSNWVCKDFLVFAGIIASVNNEVITIMCIPWQQQLHSRWPCGPFPLYQFCIALPTLPASCCRQPEQNKNQVSKHHTKWSDSDRELISYKLINRTGCELFDGKKNFQGKELICLRMQAMDQSSMWACSQQRSQGSKTSVMHELLIPIPVSCGSVHLITGSTWNTPSLSQSHCEYSVSALSRPS